MHVNSSFCAIYVRVDIVCARFKYVLKIVVTFRCNMWMLLIVKLLSFKRYNYPFYKCRENVQQM